MTPLEAIQWLRRKAQHIKLGHNYFLDVLAVIQALIAERATLWRKLEIAEKRIDELTAPPKPKHREPFGTEGQGTWNVQ